MIPDEQLDELIRTKFEILGRAVCTSKSSFMFYMKSIYGDSFNADKAGNIYDEIKKEFCGDDNG